MFYLRTRRCACVCRVWSVCVQFWELRRLPMLHVGWQPAVRTVRRMAPRGSVPSRFISTFRLNARARALRRASLPVLCEPSDSHRQFSPLYTLLLLGGVLYNLHRVEGRELAVVK